MKTCMSLINRLESVWDVLAKKGIDKQHLLAKSLLSPATCCLVNPDKERTVEMALQVIKEMSSELRKRYQLSDQY